jgi:16S rRNA (cytosine1402-N4)-methyltransferase
MEHVPVLLNEVIDLLNLKAGDVVMDATCGGGGHSEAILRKILPGGKLIAVDKDPEALARVRKRFERFGSAILYFNEDFRNVKKIIEESGIKCLDKAVFDLGMSTFQVDDGKRGFSFANDGPLDMRFDNRKGFTAKEIVNSLSYEELKDIIRDYGEERHAALVAKKICEARKRKPIQTTAELSGIIVEAVGRKYGREMLHPSVRTFQGLRIYVNDELGAASEGISKTIERLCPKGRICVISFHSLEDRIVKNIFRDGKKREELAIITKKPIVPTREEVQANPRSRSGKLRAAERI